MNDHHPSGDTTPTVPGTDVYDYGYGTGSYDYSGYDTGGHATSGYDTSGYTTVGYDTAAQDTAHYAGQQWDTGAQQTYAGYDTSYASGYASGSYDTSGLWTTAGIPQQPGPEQSWDSSGWQSSTAVYDSTYQPAAEWDTGAHGTVSYDQADYNTAASTYDTTGYDTPADTGSYATTGSYGTTGYEAPADTSSYSYEGHTDTGAYDSTAYEPQADTGSYDTTDYAAADYDTADYAAPAADPGGYDSADADAGADAPAEQEEEAVPDVTPLRRQVVRPRNRRSPKRSALLTVAVPSIAVVGVAGMAAASVGDSGLTDDKSVTAAPDPASVKPTAANAVLDTQLTGATEDAGDFADRASRTQERIDLKERQEAERKRKAEAAARKEALRPKFMLPVVDSSLSAYYGQAGVNWMSLHTGIDFPVRYGTSVRAATDGTVTTKWDYSYGNMVIITAPDGTETWYAHLSSARIRSGYVKAGDVIAYSGNSGNSTGPHLHFEVHPYGGDAIDPLPWLRSKGLSI